MLKEGIPQRIVSLAPTHTEMLFELGLGDRVVGVTRYCEYPEDGREIAKIEGFANPDLEKIISLEPDLILSLGGIQTPMVKELEARGQTVYWTYPHNVDEILESIEQVGELTGTTARARELITHIREKLDSVRSKLKNITEKERPGVFRVMGLNPPGTIGGVSFQTDFYYEAGARNIFSDTRQDFFQTNFDTLVRLDPDIIVVGSRNETAARTGLKNLAGWQDVPAVKAGRVVAMPSNMICHPGIKLAETIERLAQEFHPALFR